MAPESGFMYIRNESFTTSHLHRHSSDITWISHPCQGSKHEPPKERIEWKSASSKHEQIIYQGSLLDGKNYSQELDQGVVFFSRKVSILWTWVMSFNSIWDLQSYVKNSFLQESLKIQVPSFNKTHENLPGHKPLSMRQSARELLHPWFSFCLCAIWELFDISKINSDARITFTPIKIYEQGILESFYCQATGTLLETHEEGWPAGFT